VFKLGAKGLKEFSGNLIDLLLALLGCGQGDAVSLGGVCNDSRYLLNVLFEAFWIQKCGQSFISNSVFKVIVNLDCGRTCDFAKLLERVFFGKLRASEIKFVEFFINVLEGRMKAVLCLTDVGAKFVIALCGGAG
jgi:hypothetical protein